MENHQVWLENQIATHYGFANSVLLRAGFFGLIESDICKTDKYDDPHLYISSKDNRDGWRSLEEYLNLTIQGQLLRVRTEVNSPSYVGQYKIKKLLDEVNFFDPFAEFLATLTAREAHVLTSDRTSLPYDYFAGAWGLLNAIRTVKLADIDPKNASALPHSQVEIHWSHANDMEAKLDFLLRQFRLAKRVTRGRVNLQAPDLMLLVATSQILACEKNLGRVPSNVGLQNQ